MLNGTHKQEISYALVQIKLKHISAVIFKINIVLKS